MGLSVLVTAAAFFAGTGFAGLLLSWLTVFKKLQNGEKRKKAYIAMTVSAVVLVVGKMILNYIGVV